MTNKRKQPETSEEALDAKSSESKNRDYDRIVMALKHLGSGNYDDIAKFLQLIDANVVSRRMKEMRELKMIVNTFQKTPTRRNRMAYVHTLSGIFPKTDLQEKELNPAHKEIKKESSPEKKPAYTQPELIS